MNSFDCYLTEEDLVRKYIKSNDIDGIHLFLKSHNFLSLSHILQAIRFRKVYILNIMIEHLQTHPKYIYKIRDDIYIIDDEIYTYDIDGIHNSIILKIYTNICDIDDVWYLNIIKEISNICNIDIIYYLQSWQSLY